MATKEERKEVREAAKRELERDIRGLRHAIEDREDIEWEDIADAYEKVVRSQTRVGEAYVSYLELAEDNEEGVDTRWIEEVEQAFRDVRKGFKRIKKEMEEKGASDLGKLARRDLA